ncbi:hypothetical protein VTK26DRAFT_5057 [Humicola hyalothermophila]
MTHSPGVASRTSPRVSKSPPLIRTDVASECWGFAGPLPQPLRYHANHNPRIRRPGCLAGPCSESQQLGSFLGLALIGGCQTQQSCLSRVPGLQWGCQGQLHTGLGKSLSSISQISKQV